MGIAPANWTANQIGLRNVWRIVLGVVLFAGSFVLCAWALLARGQEFSGHAPSSLATHELHNVWQLSPRILSGSQPDDESAFAELANLGVKTIVSVDGIAPALDRARQYGLQYVHIPIGYDGIPVDSARALTRVALDVHGKIYVHCHHGIHRGPAAAAIICRADDGRSASDATTILEKAGTGREYAGLWRDVKNFELPPAGTTLPDLQEAADVETLTATMAKIDRAFNRLLSLFAQQWQEPVRPTASPAVAEAIQLAELFTEAARATTSASLRTELDNSAALARKLHQTAGSTESPSPKSLLNTLQANCKACHQQHRN